MSRDKMIKRYVKQQALFLMLAFTAFCAVGASADENNVVSSEEIQNVLTRDLGIAPRLSASGHAVPEASPHISLTTILFDLDKAELRPRSIRQLDELVSALNSEKLKDFRLLIEGHTCNRGTESHNMVLSQNRAESVKNYLLSQGISANRLETKGWGLTRPVSPNTDEQHRQRNRRVDFVKLEHATMLAVKRDARTVVTRGLSEDRFLQTSFLGQKKEGGPAFPLTNTNNTLNSGDRFQITFTVLEGCHVYVLFLSSQGEVTWLFPEEEVEYGRWCYFGEKHILPAENAWNVLDENTGNEKIILMASPMPLPNANDLPGIIKVHGSPLNSISLRERTNASDAEVKVLVINHE